jgi:hypothetical protein
MSSTPPSTILRATERETLTPDERAMFDAAVAEIPSEDNALFTALLFGSRGMVRHHGRELVTVAEGYRELLDSADAQRRDLVDAARELQGAHSAAVEELRAAAALLREQAAATAADMATIRERQDRQDEHARAADRDIATMTRHLRRTDRALILVAATVVALCVETLGRYGPWALAAGAGLLAAAVALLVASSHQSA